MKNLSTSQICIAVRHHMDIHVLISCIFASINNKKRSVAAFQKYLAFKSHGTLVCLFSIF